MSLNVVKAGDVVRVQYTTYSQDQCVIETSAHREPLSFIAGAGEVVEGVERAVLGMRVGESKRVPVMPEHAFGLRDARWQLRAPLAGIPERTAEGDQLAATVGDETITVWLKSVQDSEVQLDANHPLAGETLVYDVRVVSVGLEGPIDSVFG